MFPHKLKWLALKRHFGFFCDPKFFYGELLFEEGMVIFKKKSTQQGDFNDFSDNAKNRTGQWASKKGTNSFENNS